MSEALDVGELSRRYGPMVLRRCRRLLRDDADRGQSLLLLRQRQLANAIELIDVDGNRNVR